MSSNYDRAGNHPVLGVVPAGPASLPPPELVARIGGEYAEYHAIGRRQRKFIESLLPAGWTFEGRSVLDFGCATGRTLSAFADEAADAKFVGCDTHAESVAWARSHLSRRFDFFLCDEAPPLAQPSERFDLVYAMSVFTHIGQRWSEWLAELHRVIRPGGIAVISVLGPAMSEQILGREWDARIGMVTIDGHKDWSIGGPSVLLAEWWIREHWARGFDVLAFESCDRAAGAGHDLVALRRLPGVVTSKILERHDPSDPREHDALVCNVELLLEQQRILGEQLRTIEADNVAARAAAADVQRALGAERAERERERAWWEQERTAREFERLEVDNERARLAATLEVIRASRSWRITGPMRRAAAVTRKSLR